MSIAADGSLIALSLPYVLRWNNSVTAAVDLASTATNTSIPATSGGYTVFSVPSYLSASNIAGSALWNYPTANYGVFATPTFSIDSSYVYAGTASGYVVALATSSGTAAWAVSPCPQACAASTRALSALSADGATLFVPMARSAGGYAGVVALATANGATRWTLATNDDALALALDARGVLFVGDKTGAVYGVTASSGAVLWTASLHAAVGQFAIGANSALYVSTNSSLVALR